MARFPNLKTKPASPAVSRRQILIGGGAAVGLAVGWAVWPRSYGPNVNVAPDERLFNAWLKIATSGRITVIVPQCEMGQGVTTLLPQIIADELGADWRSIAVEPAPVSPLYANRLVIDEQAAQITPRGSVPAEVNDARRGILGEVAVRDAAMLTMASSSVRAFEQSCLDAAAAARMLLCDVAAERWNVAAEECRTDAGFVVHGNQRLRFGTLAADAANLSPPATLIYRLPESDALYGREAPRLDIPAKLDGSANFAGDIRLPDMAFAAIRHGPHGDTRLKSMTKAAAEQIVDVIQIVEHPRWVAVLADSWWSANRALDAIKPVFETRGPRVRSKAIASDLRSAAQRGTGVRMQQAGSVEAAIARQRMKLAEYTVDPALHVAIETRTATARVQDGKVQLWVATQAPGHCRQTVADTLGLGIDDVTIFQSFAGGSFGSRLDHDVAVEAAIIARAAQRPVQLTYSRAEDTMRDLPRAPAAGRMVATLNTAGTIDAWIARIAVPAAAHQLAARLDGQSAHDAARASDGQSEAAAVAPARPPYNIPHFAVDHVAVDSALPAGRWRGNADSYCCFFTESFVDELAHEAGLDPLSYRMSMLAGDAALARCLAMVGVSGSWQGGANGASQGLAIHSMRGSHIALLADARMSAKGLQVRRLTAVVDAGRLVNPDVARQQIEGGLIFGLAGAIGATTEYRDGLATRLRMRDLKLPRLAQTPEIVIEFIDSERDPGGIGELGVPVVAPALANALFSATGVRHRNLPFRIGRTA
ncbi:xanthine dehydrogenase family protein molybdopterin-binding subunit [Sphingorhabdus soli]|uniref:Xanthine dehydrogenase family protein molybdopterin-binding subunit n=1 Tax=Flavisphingopyxis soli TaxID=2601267 RepID=A0A5C6UJW1_9SPHN|nr:molybdopterin cofactor-binding domain-containing protein [Sphingorhabdus soli]TXC73253.1 xanthine dehydrogenase family protein molybdopterin-binding subunit [Sphingorhabdus soli]